MSAKQRWLVKSEPEVYSWADFVKEGATAWTGVRNYAARLNLRAMAAGDQVLFYHSGDRKEVVGISKVKKSAYPDATAEEGEWVCVDLVPVKPFKRPVSLAKIKARKSLQHIALVRQPRLSVMPLGAKEYDEILALGGLA
jgi:predicted RNA-binding protein with PUA-like domain